ncbi:MAG: diacylglycerol kinase family protein [Anaerolineae bacterium]|nr:diacylglycerol kinase family protein [Anaerolineae bacterium]
MTEMQWAGVDAPQHVLAMVNPASGSKRGQIVLERLRAIRHPRITLHATTPDFDFARAIEQGVAAGADRLLIAGGDGTLMEGVSGAFRALGEATLPFSWVPVGTGNVVSGFLGLPHRLEPALKVALGPGLIRRVDLARVGDRCSVLRVSTGFEAEVAFDVTREDKDRLGLLAYGLSGIKSLRQTRPVEYLISLDGQSPIRVEGILAFVTATGALTWINGISVINDAIQPDDGLLYAGVLRPLNPARVLTGVANLVVGSGLPPESIIYFSARKRIVVDARTPQPTQIDGDPLGTTPIIADLMPRALPIVVPRERPRPWSYFEWLSTDWLQHHADDE